MGRVLNILRSTVVEAPVASVWGLLRDFNGHDRWHPAVAESEITLGGAADVVGCVRRFRLVDGGVLREHLLALSDRDHSFRYSIIDAPIPLFGYVAHVQLKPITDGDHTFWLWESRFNVPEGRERELEMLVAEQIYEAGFEAIKERFRRAA